MRSTTATMSGLRCGRVLARQALLPYLRATSRQYHRSNVSGVTNVSSCLRALRPSLQAAIASLDRCASVKRRRLEEERTSFRDLSQSVLHETARSMLRNPALTVQYIANALGFSDATAFHRAFWRWDGRTPVEFRASDVVLD